MVLLEEQRVTLRDSVVGAGFDEKTRMGSEILLEFQVEVIQRVAAFTVQILALPARSPFAAEAGQASDGFAQSTHLFLTLAGVSAAQNRPRFGQPLPELPTRP